ncbi:cupin domain-containing protein [Amycolatopsis sp. GM8]|uniref:cupin domain-containing protein n=1 Tax=Amycolatopsis sp. GM8 TaxID=2896530 RepID=UPI001F38ABA3|nr:cupin domain-containing protein [Amycolatopsis sp. GM8]
MATAGPEFSMTDFLAGLTHVVRPGAGRPLVVHDEDLETIPPGSVPNPTTLRVAGALPTATFELFRQVIPPGADSDMQRHYHETVHFVLTGDGHSEIQSAEDPDGQPVTVTWTTGSFVYTPPWAWHRHFNDSADRPAEFLTIENSRLLALFGLARRESAGLATLVEARARFDCEEER